MCGLYGWMRHPTRAVSPHLLRTLTRTLAVLNEDRGKDSTGIAYRIGQEAPRICKAAVGAQTFVAGQRELLNMVCHEATWLIGHTRAGTVGAPTADNAHPFHFRDVIGAHNGSINNHASLPLQRDRYVLPGCDSAAFFAYADQVGIKKAVEAATGSVTFTASRAPFESVTLYTERWKNLAVAYLHRLGLLVWSSEEFHLRGALAAVGLYLDPKETGPTGFLIDWPSEALVEIRAEAIGSGDHLVWETVKAKTALPAYTGFGWGDDDGYPRGTYSYPESGDRPIKGGHQADYQSIYGKPRWHGGKKKRCGYCQSGKQWKQQQTTQPKRTGTLSAQEVLASPRREIAVILTEPTCNGSVERHTKLWLPLSRCPDCHGLLSFHVSAVAWQCLACQLWIEPQPLLPAPVQPRLPAPNTDAANANEQPTTLPA